MRKNLITGGAGFIGCNLADRLIKQGEEVVIYDNLSRLGADKNLDWLFKVHPNKFKFIKGDIRDFGKLKEVVKAQDVIYHLAAQVAVTTSVISPMEDFDINAKGTFCLLEAVRQLKINPIIVYASTNKVYGKLPRVKIVERSHRYEFFNRPSGINENEPLNFYSPYGCSKGAADQYTLDYARIYGLRTIVFRQSCIYGYRQFGVEDQGWVAWFIIASVFNRPITIYGNGKQVRDILFIDDLIDAFLDAVNNISVTNGQVYNIGGGMQNAISLLEFLNYLNQIIGKKINYSFGNWRPGDQEVFISDITKAKTELSWAPCTTKEQGIKKLLNWVKENKNLFNF